MVASLLVDLLKTAQRVQDDTRVCRMNGMVKQMQDEQNSNMDKALKKLEEMLMRRASTVANCVTAVSLQTNIAEIQLRRHWSLRYEMSVDEFYEQIFEGGDDLLAQSQANPPATSVNANLELWRTKRRESDERRRTEVAIKKLSKDLDVLENKWSTDYAKLTSIWEVPNYKIVPINPAPTEDRGIYEALRLQIAAGWLENLMIHFDMDPEILVERVAAAYCLPDFEDLKIEFDIRTNMSVYAYRNVAHAATNSSHTGVRVIDKGDGRTTYVYSHGRNTSVSSTTYYKSAYQEQQEAWQKLEDMANRARAGLAVEVKDVETR